MGADLAIDEAKIIQFLEDDLAIDTADLTADSLLFSTGIVDSFALVSLMTFLETEGDFRISTADVNLGNFDSIARIRAYSDRMQAKIA